MNRKQILLILIICLYIISGVTGIIIYQSIKISDGDTGSTPVSLASATPEAAVPTPAPTTSPPTAAPTDAPVTTTPATPTVAPTEIPVTTVAATVTPTEIPEEDIPFILNNINNTLNVRSAPSRESEKIAELPRDSFGYVIESGDTFTKIQCGDIIGYVSNDYILTGEEAAQKIELLQNTYVYITGSCRVRDLPSMKSNVITTVRTGTSYKYYIEGSNEYWYGIYLDDGTFGYVSSNYSEIKN